MCQFARLILAEDAPAPRRKPQVYFPSGEPGVRYPCPSCGVPQLPSHALFCDTCRIESAIRAAADRPEGAPQWT